MSSIYSQATNYKISASIDKGIEEITQGIYKSVVRRINFKKIISPSLLDLENFDVEPKVKSAFSHRIRLIAEKQRLWYESYLDALANELDSPSIPATSTGANTIRLRLRGGVEVATSSPGWKQLSKKTLKIKNENPAFSNTYWKHTGKLAKAFRQAVKQQKSTLVNGSFLQIKSALNQFDDSFYFDHEKGSFMFELTANVLTPKWMGKDGDLMDTLITYPYVGVTKGSTVLSHAVVRVKEQALQKRIKRYHAQLEEQELIILSQISNLKRSRKQDLGNGRTRKIALAQLENQLRTIKKQQEPDRERYRELSMDKLTQNYTGLRRLILPEHQRPFIRKLSKVAGYAARKDLKKM